MTAIILALCRRHWPALAALTFWYAAPWLAAVLGFDLSHALRVSWMAGAPFAIYMYQLTSGSQLLAILPLARREVWQLTCVVGALVPASIQFIVAAVLVLLTSVLRPADGLLNVAGMDTLLLGAVYSFAFLLLVLIATAAVRRRQSLTATLALSALGMMVWQTPSLPARLTEFTPTSALAFWVAAIAGVVIARVPGSLAAPTSPRPQSYRLTLDLPAHRVLDRFTGIKRLLVVQTLFGVVCFGGAFSTVMLLSDHVTFAEAVADELRAFSGGHEWVLQPGDSLFFMPMWVIGFANIWTPLARQLRVLPLTPREANAVFLSSPIAMWAAIWVLYLGVYATVVGPPVTPRLDLFLAISGTSTLATVISLRWKNRLYGMLGVAFVHSFWAIASIVGLVMSLTALTIPLLTVGLVFYAAAISMNHHTLVHATSASAAYQRQPKFFHTPSRS